MTVRLIVKWPRRLLVLVLLSVVIAGCSRSARRLSPDQPKAKEACTEFLTAWKEGKTIDDLSPKIVGRDADWQAGKKLLSFEFFPEEYSDGAYLHLKVTQTLNDDKGREFKQVAFYAVGTGSRSTVFRADD